MQINTIFDMRNAGGVGGGGNKISKLKFIVE